MSEGRSFKGAATTRLGGAAHVTQSPNILSSVMQRLGVLGKSHAEEMSGGRGLPIAPPAPSAGAPIPPQGAAIPTTTTTTSGLPSAPAPAASALDQQGYVTPQSTDSAVAASGDVSLGGGYVVSSDGTLYSPSHAVDGGLRQRVGSEALAGANTYVDLGNGQFYDPATGAILGQPTTADAGAAFRPLPRTGAAIPS